MNNRTEELVKFINIDDARAIVAALDRNVLSQKWLIYRLDQDWGIKIRTSVLSELLNGERPIGPKMQRVLWCAKQVLREYEDFYGRKKN